MIEKPLTVQDVVALVPHTADWVRDAANSGALESLPRGGRRHMFAEAHVAAWSQRQRIQVSLSASQDTVLEDTVGDREQSASCRRCTFRDA